MALNNPVLVLNAGWTPIRIRNVKDALKLVFAERALIIEAENYQTYKWEEWVKLPVEEGEPFIQSARMEVKCPEVIILLKYHKIPRMTRLTKKKIYMRDHGICQYTGKKLSPNEANIDHVIPRSRGGKFSWDNCVVCSKEINTKKADRTPDEAGLKLLKKPSRPSVPILFDKRKKYPKSWRAFVDLPDDYDNEAKLA